MWEPAWNFKVHSKFSRILYISLDICYPINSEICIHGVAFLSVFDCTAFECMRDTEHNDLCFHYSLFIVSRILLQQRQKTWGRWVSNFRREIWGQEVVSGSLLLTKHDHIPIIWLSRLLKKTCDCLQFYGMFDTETVYTRNVCSCYAKPFVFFQSLPSIWCTQRNIPQWSKWTR